jgi:H+-translocating NAD(P) transhydrogenase subunit beta
MTTALLVRATLTEAHVGAGWLVQASYMLATLLFIFGLKRLSRVKTARSGNALAAAAMFLAIAATLYNIWGAGGLVLILVGVLLGGGIGLVLAKRVPMTAMPELVALFNGLGGGASMFVAWAEISRFTSLVGAYPTASVLAHGILADSTRGPQLVGGPTFAVAAMLSVLIGTVTFSGSLVAYAKLAGKIQGSRLGPLGTKPLNAAIAVGVLLLVVVTAFMVQGAIGIQMGVLLLVLAAFALGVGLVVSIGGADMPVVISLLNSYSGLAACATGFVLENNLLIVAGSLVGAAGLILTNIMCKAMNRSLANVLFGGIDASAAADKSEYKNVKSTSPAELAMVLDAAQSVIFAPGYGMAVAQAQHKVRDLAAQLEKKGCQVRYAIHPVAGRMPGHMNVLLAEANVPYEQLFELDQINSDFANTDVVIVLGANDVCNPVAYEEKSPIAGMPVLDVWNARTVVVVKRSLSAGYAGIKNPLFERDNTLMLFMDGKAAMEETIAELKDL